MYSMRPPRVHSVPLSPIRLGTRSAERSKRLEASSCWRNWARFAILTEIVTYDAYEFLGSLLTTYEHSSSILPQIRQRDSLPDRSSRGPGANHLELLYLRCRRRQFPAHLERQRQPGHSARSHFDNFSNKHRHFNKCPRSLCRCLCSDRLAPIHTHA